MKKILSIILLQFLVIGFIFGATINSKVGYGDLKWGSSVMDAEKAGYKMTCMTANSDKTYLSKLYNVVVEGYKVTSKDKNVTALQFHYYQNKLFAVTELLNTSDLNPQKLESRYGNFSQQGIFLVGNQYTDAKIESNGAVSFLSIMISSSRGNVSTIMYDWNVYKKISYVGQKLAKKEEKTIIDKLAPLAKNLIQENFNKAKPSFAFTAFTTDYKNTLVENYVTDALTEAMFKTGNVKIIERANLELILKEQKFQASGLVNEATAKSIGMIAGVDFVCFGTLKDLGDEITINARVVDVETGELFAISRITIEKDDYLKNQSQSKVGSSIITPSKTNVLSSSNSQQSTSVPITNNAWNVKKFRDDFGGFTQYVFILNSSDERKLVVIYKQSKNSANDRVIAGIYWTDEYNGIWNYSYSRGIYDIKGNNSTSITKDLDNTWHVTLDVVGKKSFPIVWDEEAGSRWLIDIICKSDSVAFRRDSLTRRFQTAGLLEKMEEYGVTWAQIDAALANEEF